MGGEVMGGRGSRGRALPQPGWENGPTTPPPAPAEPADRPDTAAQHVDPPPPPADRIREIYDELAAQPGDLVSLAQLRDRLPDLSREDLDAVLLDMDRRREVQLEPDPHRIALTERAKDAAIPLGGEDMHLITVNPGPSGMDAATEQVTKPPVAAGDQIRNVYTDLAGSDGRWIDLTEVRTRLSDLPRAEVDAALRDLIRDDRVRLEPEPFGHRIGPAERDAAIHIGGEDRHKLWIEPEQP
jgi:hypothetical protein